MVTPAFQPGDRVRCTDAAAALKAAYREGDVG